METDEGSPDFDATKAELFDAISHPARIKILQALSEKPMGFAQLGRAVGIESSGHLTFHLNKLGHLVKTNPDGNYALTPDGKEALWSVSALRKATSAKPTEKGSSLRHVSMLRPILAVVVVAIVALGGLSAYEQEEYASQQQQLKSQQTLVGILEKGLPFVDGQNASLVIGQTSFTSYKPATSQSGLNQPTDVAFDSSGNMWVSEWSNYRVLEFKPPFTSGMKASLVIGHKDFTSEAGFTTKDGLGVYVSPYCCGPNALTFDSFGNLWVADHGANRILEFKPPFTNGMNASLVIGHKDFNTAGDLNHLEPPLGPASRDRLFSPDSVVFDSLGNLWVLDAGNNRALEFKPPFSDGMNASLVLGQSNFQNDGPSQGLNGLSCNFGYVALDPYGDVWVGDAQNNRIVEFRPPFGNGMNASFIITQQNLAINSEPSSPFGSANLGWLVGFDPAGNLWVTSNDRFLVFKPPFTSGIRSFPSLEIGQPNFTATVWNGSQNGFGVNGAAGATGPSGFGFDSSGNLWVADSNNNRVIEFAAGSAAYGATTHVPALLNPGQLLLVPLGVAALLAGGAAAFVFLRRKVH